MFGRRASPSPPAATTQESAEKRVEGYVNALKSMVDELEHNHFRSIQKESFLCCARCCDESGDMQAVQACVNRCQVPAQTTQELTQSSIQQFQDRLQRCVTRCIDTVQQQLPVEPSQEQIQTAQGQSLSCQADCAEEYERLVPKLRQDILHRLKSSSQ